MIAVVGAGMAGATAARSLADRGLPVTVVDKSPRVGGRMATRRMTLGDGRTARFDHGCQYLTATTPEFRQVLEMLHAEGVVRPWPDPPVGLAAQASPGVPHVAPGGMRSVVERLLCDLPTLLGERVVRLTRTKDGWQLVTDRGTTLDAAGVVLTLPVPQSLELLFQSGVSLPRDELHALREVEYSRSLSLLSPSRESPRPRSPYDIDYVCDQHEKGVSPAPAWAVLLTPSASEARYEDEIEAVARVVLGGVPVGVQLHRWRYCRPGRSHPERYTFHDGLALAGDGFGAPGGTAETAYLSGAAVVADPRWHTL